jgi:2,3-bisphosphoglycerate-independent phosphoglycerate mutase
MEMPVECSGNMLWVWSPSEKPEWPSFSEMTGMKGACIGGLDFLHGIAMAADMHFDIVPGATGYIDTNYDAKAHYAIEYLRHYDLVLVHVNATDEEAHMHNHEGKRKAIEAIDQKIIGPIMMELHANHPEYPYVETI